MKQVRFFAVDDDIFQILDEVERHHDLQYVRTGLFSTPTVEVCETGSDLSGIGVATNESAINCDSFLVAECTTSICARPIVLTNGTNNFCIDQLDNSDTVILTPAGRWGEEVVLYGTVGTVSNTESSIRLMKTFDRAFRKQFRKIKAFWVGPKALALLHAGKRLTIAAQSPKEFDLSSD